MPHINEILNNSTLPTIGASTIIAQLVKIFQKLPSLKYRPSEATAADKAGSSNCGDADIPENVGEYLSFDPLPFEDVFASCLP